ncbi:MAG: polysaccharide biosynthesis C-terminal domain-containing protein [Planctomycetota bacterium]|nr:polysaccharide biosynthesis C-terminal domain-containing protein [Planctomycetota bacterium]MDA1213060.1 polysaccharide biosynthesis C-terminal domain-containing protein [Planctomycetota bacterium]
MTTNRDVAIGGMYLAAIAVFCRVLSLGKELYVGSQYGTSIEFEVYAIALLIPSLGIGVVAQAARRGYLSWYARFQIQGADSLRRFEFHFLTILTVGSLVATLGLALLFGLPWNSWLPWKLSAIEELSHISWYAASLLIPMTGVVGLTTLLNARKEFVVPQSTHLFPPFLTVLLVVVFPHNRNAELLITGLLLGTIIQCIILLVLGSRYGITPSAWWQSHRERALSSDAYTGFKYAILAMIALELLVQGNTSVDRLMADALDDGQVALLYWSSLMKDFVSGTVIASLLTVQFPHVAEQAANHNYAELKRCCTLTLRYGALLIFPFTVIMIVGVAEILPLLSLGRIDHTDMAIIAPCFSAYAVGFFADLASTSLSQGLMVLGRTRTLILIGIFGYFLPNLIFNVLLITPFGVVGLAASTSLVAYCTLICNVIVIRKIIGPFEQERQTWNVVGMALAATGIMAFITVGLLSLLHPLLSGDFWQNAIRVAIAIFASVVAYAALILITPAKTEMGALLTMTHARFRRKRS